MRDIGDRIALLRGTLDLLILQVLTEAPRHGYAIARRIEGLTDEVLRVEEGSLYPALHRMESRGWIEAEWGRTDGNRRVRVYTLTADGKQQLHAELRRWGQFSAAVEQVVQAT